MREGGERREREKRPELSLSFSFLSRQASKQASKE